LFKSWILEFSPNAKHNNEFLPYYSACDRCLPWRLGIK
jgi:hypothetical protein